MSGQPSILREIIEGPSYAVLAKKIDPTGKSLDSRLEDLLFVIARIPEEFPAVPRTKYRRAVLYGSSTLAVWFTFDDHHVTLLGIIER